MKKLMSLLVGALVAALLPVGSAFAAPSIAFLSPTPTRADQVPELSDKDGRVVHLVVTVGEVPSNAQVEFEIQGNAGLTSPFRETIDGTSRVGANTWEAFWSIPDTFADGTYTLSARLYSNLVEVATDTQLVTINQAAPDAADNVELSIPDNGSQFGFFTPKGKLPNGIVLADASSGTDQVRILYTMSNPGARPEWTQCGTGGPGEAGATRVRCTVKEGDNPLAITAIAAVANQTPRGTPADATFDDGMDAHTIQPYAQVPSSISMSPSSTTAEAGKCQLLSATLSDQLGQVIAAANLDVHAQGPTDSLTFATSDTSPLTNETHAYQGPDGHVSNKLTVRCSDKAQTGISQGLHRLATAPDRIHIEAVSGTDNFGTFVFALYSPHAGPTNVIAWADVNDDDTQSLDEATGQAQIGWNQDPPPPQGEIFIDPDTASGEVGSCQSLTLITRQSGSPLAGQNVDIHISGPDATTAFCDPAGANTSRRNPDQGAHFGDSHTDMDARHAEGETDSMGRFVFGVTSVSNGRVRVIAWMDQNDDDLQQATEQVTSADVTFSVDGDRSVSLNTSRRRVPKGRRVRLFGSIQGSDVCEANQTVKLRAKPLNGRWRVIGKKTTTTDGNFSFRRKVWKTKDYRVVAPKDGPCEFARSPIRRVRRR